MLKKIIKLSRVKKQLIALFFDSIFIMLIVPISFFIRLGYWNFYEKNLIVAIIAAPIIAIPIFIKLGLYRAIIRYIGFQALLSILKAVSLYALIWGLLVFMLRIEVIPRSAIFINWSLAILAIGGLRVIAKWLLVNNKAITNKNDTKRINILWRF
jgi:FlaA1/EpsC-like NDP-sugar epimerase